MKNQRILNSQDAVLVVVDIQEKLHSKIFENERVTENSVKLIEACKVMEVPIITTLQYREKLGECVQPIEDALPDKERLNKMTFSCMGADCFPNILNNTDRKQVILCGIETHVCVNQTAHDLLSNGYNVHVVKDAVSSRTKENWIAGIEKMRDSGCIITSTEMAIFEMVRDASSEIFKKILPVVK